MKCILVNNVSEEIYFINECYKSNSGENFGLNSKIANSIEFGIEGYWRLFKNAVKKILNISKIKTSEIISIAISSQGETLIRLDKNGKSLRNAIV